MTPIRELAATHAPVSDDMLGREIYDRFQDEPALLAIAVVDRRNRPIGLIERHAFFHKLAANYGRALYAGRPISLLMDCEPIVVDGAARIADFINETVLARSFALHKGFIVVEGGLYYGVGAGLDLLRAVSAENERRATEQSALNQTLALAHDAAAEAHSRLRQAVDSMPEGLAFFDERDRLILWNRRYADLHPLAGAALGPGISFTELARRGLERGEYPEAVGREDEWLQERLALRSKGSGAHEQALAHGRWARVEERVLPTGARINVLVDITELKRREASFRLLFEGNPVPMVVFGAKRFELLALNDAAEAKFGHPRTETLGRSALEFLAPELHERAVAVLRSGLTSYRAEETWTHLDAKGRRLEIMPYLQAMTWADQPAYMSAMIDVTEAKAATQALTEARDAAEAANRAKSAFLANMSHEIRTPLNGVIGLADALARTRLEVEQRQMIEVVRSSAGTLERLLSDVLDLARVESGRIELHCEPFHLGEAVRDVARLCQPAAADKGVALIVDVSPDVERSGLGDAVRVRQILTNLLSNAVKFTSVGEVRVRATAIDDSAVLFTVKDTGVGFDADQKARIFARFQQADGSIARRFGGAGLGLAISRELAGLMGATLDCESAPGEGSTFTFQVRLPNAAPSRVEAPVHEPQLGSDRPLRILLADDHPVNRQVVELMLADAGASLRSVENGRDAVDAFRAEAFDLVLMDMQMPVLDGLSAVREIRVLEVGAGAPRTPIIMLTANAMSEHVEQSLQAGADLHLGKPIRAEALYGAIGQVLEAALAAQAA